MDMEDIWKIYVEKKKGCTYRIYGGYIDLWIWRIYGKDMWKRRGVAHIGYMEDADSWASSNHVTPRSSPIQLLLCIISHLAPTSKMQIPELRFDHDRKSPLNEC